jgi:hypothetical protein
MFNRTTDFLLTVVGTVLMLLTLACVLLVPIFVGFNAVSAKPGGGKTGFIILGSLGFLALAAACAAAAWAVRRVIKRREAAARR